jgi:hypothetical protein
MARPDALRTRRCRRAALRPGGAFDAFRHSERVLRDVVSSKGVFSMARAFVPAVLLLLPALALGQAAPEVKAEAAPAASAPQPAPAATAISIDPGTAAKPAEPAASTVAVDPRTWGKPEPEWKSHRELAGHVFVPSTIILDPFSQTAFGLKFGLGGGSATGPTLDWSGFPLRRTTLTTASASGRRFRSDSWSGSRPGWPSGETPTSGAEGNRSW